MRVYSSAVALVGALSVSPSLGFVHSRVASFRVNDASSHDAAVVAQPQHQLQQHNKIDALLVHRMHRVVLFSSPVKDSEAVTAAPSTKKKKLGLITFDLDDTLYPIAPVLDEANTAFSTAMSNFGYVNIQPSDIVATGKEIRAQVFADDSTAAVDPLKPATVNHKEIRMAAIRQEMEQFILKTKLQQTADDWATEVESLTDPVRKSAEK